MIEKILRETAYHILSRFILIVLLFVCLVVGIIRPDVTLKKLGVTD